jgi:hypothetical protein
MSYCDQSILDCVKLITQCGWENFSTLYKLRGSALCQHHIFITVLANVTWSQTLPNITHLYQKTNTFSYTRFHTLINFAIITQVETTTSTSKRRDQPCYHSNNCLMFAYTQFKRKFSRFSNSERFVNDYALI